MSNSTYLVSREIASLNAAHFESDLARTIYNDSGRVSRLPERVLREMEKRLIAWAQTCTAASCMKWGPRIDASLVPRLSPAGFRRFSAVIVERHPQALEALQNTRESVRALAKAVHVSQHINPAVLDRLMHALANEGLSAS